MYGRGVAPWGNGLRVHKVTALGVTELMLILTATMVKFSCGPQLKDAILTFAFSPAISEQA
jgi:hypothetical protein